MAKLPYMQFYPADYQSDVRRLSMASRGAWMEILCVLWRSHKNGTLTLSLEEWARELSCPPHDVSLYLIDLAHHKIGKISREIIENIEHITISSKRIMREKMKQKLALKRKQKQRDASMSRSCHALVTPLSHQSHAEESDIRSQSQKSESEEEKKEEEKRALRVSTKRSAPQSDEEWLTALKGNEAYTGIDVSRELVKCRNWCEVNRKTFSRRRFINWLNHADRPMQAAGPLGPIIKPPVIPPFPGPEDPIGRNSWRRAYGTLAQVR